MAGPARLAVMGRRTILSLTLLCIALASVVVGAVVLIRRDRAAMIERFASERLVQLEMACRDVSDSLEDAGDDLRFASELLVKSANSRDHERELRALLEVIGEYKAIAVYSGDGEPQLALVDRNAPDAKPDAYRPAMADAAREAQRLPPGEIFVSPPFPAPLGGWYRAFATALPAVDGKPGGAVAVLIDTEPFFAPLRLIGSQPDSQLLVLGARGTPVPATHPALDRWLQRLPADAAQVPRFAEIASRLKSGESGTLILSEDEAMRLGLGRAEAVAAFAPIRVKGGQHWSVATLVSTSGLRSHERGVILRLGFASALVAFFLVAFSVYVVVAARRAVALTESRRHADRLAHLHDTTQKILDNIPVGVLALSADGRIASINQALRARLSAGAVGVRLAAAFPHAPESLLSRLEAMMAESCASQRVLTLQGEPLTLFGEDGQYRLHVVPLAPRDPDVRVLLVIEDLSDLRALEVQLLRAEKLATVGVLAAGIAHEIGTPLGVVRGRAEYMLGKLGAGHPQAAGVQVIVGEIDRVSRTIRQLLDFARVQPAAVRPVALGPVARNVQELLRVEAERRKVKLELDVPEGLPLVAADPDQMQQALVNLTLNACDACSPGGVVRISAAAPAGAWEPVRISLRDNGCGIPAENLAKVFDPFFTTKKRGVGTGLGLTMVAQIVRNHGGRVELESEPGRGTCVTLLWPAATATEERHAG